MENNTWPSDEALELAAVSAETWYEHGGRSCEDHLLNEDGFM